MFSINKLLSKNGNGTDGVIMVLIVLLTAIASEIKVVPFNGEAFRFGLGSVTFFLLILIWTPVSLIRTGLVTGITVVCFRVFEDIVLHEVVLLTSLKSHIPAFLFYFIFALGLHIIKIERYKTSPLILGSWASLFELIGNGAEQFMRSGLLHHATLDFREWALISGVALVP